MGLWHFDQNLKLCRELSNVQLLTVLSVRKPLVKERTVHLELSRHFTLQLRAAKVHNFNEHSVRIICQQ
jgi:hypothetical protein